MGDAPKLASNGVNTVNTQSGSMTWMIETFDSPRPGPWPRAKHQGQQRHHGHQAAARGELRWQTRAEAADLHMAAKCNRNDRGKKHGKKPYMEVHGWKTMGTSS